MNELNEIKIRKPVEISKSAFKCDDIISSDIPNPLPGSKEGWFRMAVVGKSGSGKTNLLRALTEKGGKNKIYFKQFSNVFYISPSVKSMHPAPKLDPNNFYESLNDLPEIIDRIQNEQDKDGRTLIIMDDVSHEINKTNMQFIKQLYQNNRHLGRPLLDEDGNQIESGSVSTIIISQRLNNLPRNIRSQVSHWCIFDPTHTKSELSTIYDELIHADKNLFNKIIDKTYSTPYNFLFIDTVNSKLYNGFKSEFVVNTKNYL